MTGRALVLVAALCTGVGSLPVTSVQLESEDVKVMKCIVEALADVLSRPRPLPVTEECLQTLRSDDRLVAILRHRSFLKELQDIALGGNKEQALVNPPLQQSQSPQTVPDQSMLESLGGPGERSILDQQPTRRGTSAADDGPRHEESAVRRDHEEKEEEEKKRDHQEKKGEKRDSMKKKSTEENKEETRRAKVWSKRNKPAPMKEAQEEEVPHHSKETPDHDAEARRRSPEEAELQLIARTTEEREDEGSGAKKLDIESLAAIESELEGVAQRLHDLRRTERGQQRA